MANAVKKWTEERTQELVDFVGEVDVVTLNTVAEAADQLETTTRSIASKLRKLGYEVEKTGAKGSKFSEAQAEALGDFIQSNSGEYTYAEIAEAFEDGAFNAKQIQGKILSMELTSHVKPSPKPETARKYSEAEEATFLKMANGGATLEEIAEAMGRPIASVRGKALSFLRSGEIESIPTQETSNAKAKADAFESLGNVAEMTVEQIAEALGKTVRGVRTMLTRRGVSVADYDGAAKRAKADSQEAA